MKRIYRMAAAAAIALALAGCKDKIGNGGIRPDPADVIVFSIAGQKVFDYNEQNWQNGFNADKKTFFLISDEGGEWLEIKCSEFPEQAGQTVSVTLKWKTAGMDKASNADAGMEVLSVDEGTGIISLWNARNSIFIGLPNAI